MTDRSDTSYFVTRQQVQSCHLLPGAVLQVCWKTSRRCHFLHLGDGSYRVILSENSKLAVDDTFHCDTFFVGIPTYFNNLVHLGSDPMQYVIGKRGGVTELSVVALNGETSHEALAQAFDIHSYLQQNLPVQDVIPSPLGTSHGVVPLHQVLTNALRIGLLVYDGLRLVFPACCPERECGFMAHTLRTHYTFSTWGEIDSLVVRLKNDGTIVKTLRQTRNFSPFDRSDLRDELFRQIFLTAE